MTPEFKVEFSFMISLEDDSDDVWSDWLVYETTIPFIPFVGMMVNLTGNPEPVEEVVWYPVEGKFIVSLKSESLPADHLARFFIREHPAPFDFLDGKKQTLEELRECAAGNYAPACVSGAQKILAAYEKLVAQDQGTKA